MRMASTMINEYARLRVILISSVQKIRPFGTWSLSATPVKYDSGVCHNFVSGEIVLVMTCMQGCHSF